MQKFDLFVPFGSVCITSWNLRKNGLQTESMPYDWIGPMNLDLTVTFLENGFSGLIEKDKLKFIGTKDHEVHYEMPNGVTFQHDFTKKSMEEFPKVEVKYQRRIKRLYEKLAAARSVMFVHFDEIMPQTADLEKAVFRLKKLYPGKRLKLLYVFMSGDIKGWKVKADNDSYELVILEHDKNGNWVGNMPLISEILAPYGLTLKARLANWWGSLRHKAK